MEFNLVDGRRWASGCFQALQMLDSKIGHTYGAEMYSL
jgi:hypothetical protein